MIEANTAAKTFYFDLKRYRAKLPENDTPFTPANTLIKAQRVSLKKIRAEGIENLWARHARMGAAARAGVAAMGLTNFAERPNNALTVVTVPPGIDGNELLEEPGEEVRLQAGERPGHAQGQDLAAVAHGLLRRLRRDRGPVGAGAGAAGAGFKLEPGAGVAAAQRALAASR